MSRMKEDLPAPLGPRMAVCSPSRISRDRPSRMRLPPLTTLAACICSSGGLDESDLIFFDIFTCWPYFFSRLTAHGSRLTAHGSKTLPADIARLPGRRRRLLGGGADRGDSQELLGLFP